MHHRIAPDELTKLTRDSSEFLKINALPPRPVRPNTSSPLQSSTAHNGRARPPAPHPLRLRSTHSQSAPVLRPHPRQSPAHSPHSPLPLLVLSHTRSACRLHQCSSAKS